MKYDFSASRRMAGALGEGKALAAVTGSEKPSFTG
jgi:hypothetical protein